MWSRTSERWLRVALRVRADGSILCARLHPAAPGDAYLDDGVHYTLSVEHRILVTEPMPKHGDHGRWWWKGQEPKWAEIDPFYYEDLVREEC